MKKSLLDWLRVSPAVVATSPRGRSRRGACASRIEPLESRRLLALTASLLSDVNPGPDGSDPTQFVWVDNGQPQLIFTADDGTHGRELWRSDGTSLGTTLLADIRPGPAGSSPSQLTVTPGNGRLFFAADDGVSGMELWKVDGNAVSQLADIFPGPNGSNIAQLSPGGFRVYFAANDGTHGNEVWISDGSLSSGSPFLQPTGTFFFRDVNPGPDSSNPAQFLAVFTAFPTLEFVFVADDGVHGAELWASKGHGSSTNLVKDINPGSDGASISEITLAGSLLFFAADNGSDGLELWKSDGTEAGTVLVKDIVPGALGSAPQNLVNVGGTLYFTADDGAGRRELWMSDGTDMGTVLVKDISGGGAGSSPDHLVNVSGTLFFSADDGTGGRELWMSDGTAAGTVMVKDIRPGAIGSDPRDLVNVDGVLFFTADDGTSGREVWTSDGTAAGTALVADIRPGSEGSDPQHLTNIEGRLFFAADDGSHGVEPWMIAEAPTGPGTDTIGLYDPVTSTFFYKNTNSPGVADGSVQYGPANSGWLPLAGDWDGDGDDSFGLYDPVTSTFFLKHDLTPGAADVVVQFGPADAGWQPVVGDFDGDGSTTIGLYDPTTGTFYLQNSNVAGPAEIVVQFGTGTTNVTFQWRGLAGDWDGDGVDTIGIESPPGSSSTIYNLKNSFTSGPADVTFLFGPQAIDLGVVGDWNGGGQDGLGRYDPVTGTFFLRFDASPGAADRVIQFGPTGSGWLPLAGNWDGTTAGFTLQAAAEPIEARLGIQPLLRDELLDAVGVGLAQLAAAGLDMDRLASLANLDYQIVDLPGALLGLQSAGTVWIDYNAAGHGWFTDLAPGAMVDADRFDLLTVVLHELGHELGFDDLDNSTGWMSSQLALGSRSLPTPESVDEFFLVDRLMRLRNAFLRMRDPIGQESWCVTSTAPYRTMELHASPGC